MPNVRAAIAICVFRSIHCQGMSRIGRSSVRARGPTGRDLSLISPAIASPSLDGLGHRVPYDEQHQLPSLAS